jgi:hypothetical protein
MPNKKLNPTQVQRDQVRTLAASGLTLEQIGLFMDIRSPKTLRRYFPKEIIQGRSSGELRGRSALFKMAISGKHPRATMHFLKKHAGWNENMERDRICGIDCAPYYLEVNIREVVPDRPPDRIIGVSHESEEDDNPWHDPEWDRDPSRQVQ